jgi:hypothetical protein
VESEEGATAPKNPLARGRLAARGFIVSMLKRFLRQIWCLALLRQSDQVVRGKIKNSKFGLLSLKSLAVFQVFILAKPRSSRLLSQNFSFGKVSLI